MTLKAAEFFSGICGFTYGFDKAGIETVCLTEWDPNARSVIQHHYPHIPLMGDITDVQGAHVSGGVDVFAGGFPCQDTSIAAPHRAGLAGKRSGHFHEFTRLVAEYARLVEDARPRWVVIENPTGLLTSPQRTGRDMATVVGTLEELGYGWAYRVVDGGQLGTPQRRGRIIVVGHRGGDPRPAWQVLGDAGDRGEDAPASRVGRRPIGPAPAGGAAFDAVWRKSARARAAVSAGGYETWVSDGKANTLTGFDGGGPARQTHLIAQGGRLRTLTLTEWERLQGFPDGWTAMVKSDSARYKMLGNAIHTGTSEWLGRRLKAVHEALPLLQETA